jgi:prepilin-type N-terminal cleavage/methylation domain-containing protein
MSFMVRCLRRFAKLGDNKGFTMLEMITVLAVIGVMAATLTPMVLNYLEDAKRTKAESDVKQIAAVILNLTRDVRHFPMYTDGKATTGVPTIELLHGPGNPPPIATVATTTEGQAWAALALTGLLENHLVKNMPSGLATTDTTKYATTGRFSWRGPYLEKLTEDPWGNRYLVNIKNGNPGENPAKVIWVLSAGPNGIIETNPNAFTDEGPVTGGDDTAIRIR